MKKFASLLHIFCATFNAMCTISHVATCRKKDPLNYLVGLWSTFGRDVAV